MKPITNEELEDAVKISCSVMEVLRRLGRREAGGTHAHFSRRIKNLKLDTSHFVGKSYNKGRQVFNKRHYSDILKLRFKGRRESAKRLRRALIESGVIYECEKCGQKPYWCGSPLTLDIDHKNNNWLDDRKENLRFLCPNCHSQFSRNICVF